VSENVEASMQTFTVTAEDMALLAQEGEALLIKDRYRHPHSRDFLWCVIKRAHLDGDTCATIAEAYGMKLDMVQSLVAEFGTWMEPKTQRNRQKAPSKKRQLSFKEALRFNQLRISETAARWKRFNQKLRQERQPTIAERRKNDPQFKMRLTLANRVISAIKRMAKHAGKSARTMELTGCTTKQLVQHIESQFKKGMTWQNHGRGEHCWHIDHIMPCKAFDLTKPAQQRQCFHWTNLRPAWELDNLRKNSKITVPQLSLLLGR
jgi:hypothetical protein